MRFTGLLLVLMLAGCASERGATPLVPEAAAVGDVRSIFVVTNREPSAVGMFGFERAEDTSRLRLDVSVPPNRTPGTVSDGQASPNPAHDFTLVAREDFGSRAAFQSELGAAVHSGDGSVSIFVHGYNNTFVDPVFRMAQLAHDLDLPSALVTLSWPSRANPLGYQYDTDSTYYSRGVMQQTLFDMAATNPSEFILVAHSMGSVVVMETLRQIELTHPGWAAANLDGVVLMSPDLDVDVFRQVMLDMKEIPEPFIIFTSGKDRALRLSARLRGDEVRVGNLTDPTPLADLPVQLVDLSAFSERRSTNHLTAAGSPAVLSIMNAAREFNRGFAGGQAREVEVIPGTRRVFRNATQIILVPPR